MVVYKRIVRYVPINKNRASRKKWNKSKVRAHYSKKKKWNGKRWY